MAPPRMNLQIIDCIRALSPLCGGSEAPWPQARQRVALR